MPAASMGSATAKGGGGGQKDPNVLDLKEANRIRILEPVTFKWRQHFIESTTDSEQGRPVVCPKGPDGRDQSPCPLCMKPVGTDGKQRFPISRRFATNVWDYESQSVKVLIAGPQVFEEFDAYVALGLDPTAADILVHKMGKGINTSYKVVRANETPMPTQIQPGMLHDLDKYDTPDSTEKIFEKLEAMGWDYDDLEMPSYTLEEAEAFQMPYGKFKGLTIEQIVANDPDYAQFIHGSKKDDGSLGDPVFIALQVVLENAGLVPELEDVPTAPPAPAASKAPEAAPAPPVAQETPPVASGMVALVGPDGLAVAVPEAAVSSLLAAGYTHPVVVEPEPPSTHRDVVINGTVVNLDNASADALIAAGTATEVVAEAEQPAAPAYQLPADDAMVMFKLDVIPNPIEMAFKDAKRIAAEGKGEFMDQELAAAVSADAADDKQVQQEVATAVAADPTPPGGTSGDPYDPALTVQDADGTFTHPALEGGGKHYKTKGGVTQALNKLRGAAPTPAVEVPVSSGAPAATASGVEAKLNEAKNLLRDMPEIQSDFKKLIELFDEVAGKRQITDFTEPELDKLIERLNDMKAAA